MGANQNVPIEVSETGWWKLPDEFGGGVYEEETQRGGNVSLAVPGPSVVALVAFPRSMLTPAEPPKPPLPEEPPYQTVVRPNRVAPITYQRMRSGAGASWYGTGSETPVTWAELNERGPLTEMVPLPDKPWLAEQIADAYRDLLGAAGCDRLAEHLLAAMRERT